ncbi:MAG TPA: S1/P1 nuclease [Pyrinomonadaceae bacterium]|nr:S1/P1 nuclease [Pyrinomonadaceae bacterium]
MSCQHMHSSFAPPAVAALFLVLMCAALPAPVMGWGKEGHHIVAMIAEKRLSATARQKLNTLLKNHQQLKICKLSAAAALGDKLACVSTWADRSRNNTHPQTYNWHFVDISLRHETYDERRDCEPDNQEEKGKCGLEGLERMRSILRGETTDPEIDRAQALMFIVHIVGDLHQPLHTVKEKVGGNSFNVLYFKIQTDLHKVWDTKILASRMSALGETESGYADVLNGQIDGAGEASLLRGDAVSWLNETHAVAIEDAYGTLKQTGGGKPSLGKTYFEHNWPIVDEQLKRGGVRLARILKDDLR